MKKIPTLFERDRNTHLVINQVTPGCEWVLAGEGIATRKWDGTCCMIRNRVMYKRRELARYNNAFPDGFEACGPADPVTGKIQGWMPITPADKWHLAVFHSLLEDGTYELVGPKINGNPDKFPCHCLVRHGDTVLSDVPRDFVGLSQYTFVGEGVVWHHPDGRMVKIKRKDFR